MKTKEMLKEIETCLEERSTSRSVRVPLPLMREIVDVLETFEETVNGDYERSELLTHLHNGWLEGRNTTTLSNIAVLQNGNLRVLEVRVSTRWLLRYIRTKFHESDLNKFLNTYGYDEIQSVFRDSTLDRALVAWDLKTTDQNGKRVYVD